MNKRIFASLIAIAVALAAFIVPISNGQTAGLSSKSSATATSGVFMALPPSDAVMSVNVRALLNTALPRILAGDPAKLSQINADIDKFKARTGIDARSFERISVGMSFNYPSAGITKVNTVAIAQGSFNSAAIVAAGRLAAKGKYQEQKYSNGTIYIFSLNDQTKMLGMMNMKVHELAVSALDANTLAIGNLASVRAAIDTSRAGKVGNTELVALATRDPNALIGFGANLSPVVMQNLNLGNDEIARNVSSIRQAYGSIGATTTGFELLTFARTEKLDQAQGLSDMLAGLKQIGAMYAGQLQGAKGTLAKNALESLKITTQGNEIQLRMELAQADIATLTGLLNRSQR